MNPSPLSATRIAHLVMDRALSPGDLCIDATAGNGHDTVFLRSRVGPTGQVLAIDIQGAAIEATGRRLRELGLEKGYRLVEGDHSRLDEITPGEWRGRTRVICFNLGYLPGGDRRKTTETNSTIKALAAALDFLAPGGLFSVTAYPGHEEGAGESAAVAAYLAGLSAARFEVCRYVALNAAKAAPVLHLVRKKETKTSSRQPGILA